MWSNLLLKWLNWRYPPGKNSIVRRFSGFDRESARVFWVIVSGCSMILVGIIPTIYLVRELGRIWQ